MLTLSSSEKSASKMALNPISGLMWGAVVALFLLGMLALGTYSNFVRLGEANKWHVHTYEVLSQVATVRSSFDKIERHLLGYAISADRQYIESAVEEDIVREQATKRLLTLTSDKSQQSLRLETLNRKYDLWYKRFVSKYTDSLRTVSPALAGLEIAQRHEELLELQQLLSEVETTERTLLATRTREQAKAQSAASAMLLLGSAFTICFASALLFMLGRIARDHERAARELETANNQLNQEVIERQIATDKAHASEEIYRHLADDSIDLICRHSPDGRLTYVSPASQSLIGFKTTEMLGLTPMHFLFPTEKRYLLHRWEKSPQKQFSQIIDGTTQKPLLRRYLHRDGHEVWLETIGHAIFDSQTGEVREWHTTSRDVSARVRAEENRQRMAVGLRLIVEVTDELLLCPDEATLIARSIELGQQRLKINKCNIFLFETDGKGSWDKLNREGSPTQTNRNTRSKSEAFSAYLRKGSVKDAENNGIVHEGTDHENSESQNAGSTGLSDLHESLRSEWEATTTISSATGELGVFCYDCEVEGDSEKAAEQDSVTQEIVAVYCSILGTLLERERTQSRWRESRKILQTIVDNAPMLLYAVDKEGYFTVIAGRALGGIGMDSETNIGRHVTEVMHGDSESFKTIQRVLAGESMHETMYYGERYIELWREPVFGANGQIEGALGVGFDNTERVLAELELRDSLEMQRAILAGASYSIIATDADGIIRVFNGAAEQMLGYSAREMIGSSVQEFFPLIYDLNEVEARARDLSHELDRPIIPDAKVLVTRARAGLRDESEWTNTRKDGTKFPVRLAVQAMRDTKGEIIGYVSIGYDLTESRRAERMKNEFVSVVSHELRTPLTSIRGSLGLMQGGIVGELPGSAKQMIDIAAKNADRLVLLINDILDIEKIESEQMRFEFGEISLGILLRNAIEANRAYGETLGIDIQLDEEANLLEPLSIYGDESRLMQVLTNFLSNACKFSPEGGTVWIGAKRISHGRARVWVSDEGEGISPEFESRLFERFMQADSSATRKKGGTGLGLAIAKAIIEKHGGRIGYLKPYSPQSPGVSRRGATFYFDVDLIDMSSISPKALPKVLILEDDEDVAGLLKSLMAHSGYEAEVASTVAQARERLMSGETFTAMTLDLELPDGNGIEFLREIRESSESKMLREMPVLVVSAHCESGKLRGGALGVVDWLEKPFEPQKILESIALTKHVGKAKILHVEDDADVRRVTELILSDAAQITPAASLYEAKVALKNNEFHLALIDVGLPDGSGLELISVLSALDPPVPVVLFSAREDEISHLETVAASLTKSRTTNAKLRETIGKLIVNTGK